MRADGRLVGFLLFPQIHQVVQFTIREGPGNESRFGAAMGTKGCELEIGKLICEKPGQREYSVTGVALENGLPYFPSNHGQKYCG
jgi:hypothetical protein